MPRSSLVFVFLRAASSRSALRPVFFRVEPSPLGARAHPSAPRSFQTRPSLSRSQPPLRPRPTVADPSETSARHDEDDCLCYPLEPSFFARLRRTGRHEPDRVNQFSITSNAA